VIRGRSARRRAAVQCDSGDNLRSIRPRYLLAGAALIAAGAVLYGCGGGSGGTGTQSKNVSSNGTSTAPQHLTSADVQTAILQAANEATARGTPATIAVVDRVGNVLGVMQMAGTAGTVTVTSQRTPAVTTGLDGAAVPSTLAAIAKAITGAYLSSNGNAFTSRTASQIVQEHFNPPVDHTPSGPLFGVQFSQLPCSDLSTAVPGGSGTLAGGAPGPGPHHSPLGFSADAGGLPLYKGTELVGGIGVISDGIYGLSAFPPTGFDTTADLGDELIALAGQSGFTPPDGIKASRISVGLTTFRYVDADAGSLHSISSAGTYTGTAVPGYYAGGAALDGTTFLDPASGIRADTGDVPGVSAYVIVDGTNTNRFAPIDSANPTVGAGGLSRADVQRLLASALRIALRSRAQIRMPSDSFVQVTVSVVDLDGKILGVARTPDAPVFGTDVSLQKARTVVFFSKTGATFVGAGTTPADQLTAASLTSYVTATNTFFGTNILKIGGLGNAFSEQSIGELSRPYYPDGQDPNPNGPLSRPFGQWSPFSTGVQLDLIAADVVAHLGSPTTAPPAAGCGAAQGLPVTASGKTSLANGMMIFSGAVPVYRGSQLIGGIGVSGDGTSQDNMVAFLGLNNAGGGINNAPTGIRSDQLVAQGSRLPFINCPANPFIDDPTAGDPCSGL